MKVEFFTKKQFIKTQAYSGVNDIKTYLTQHQAVVVHENEKYVGVLTAFDIIKRPHNLVIDCLSEKQSIDSETKIVKAIEIMRKSNADCLPVFNKNSFIGIVYKNDLLEYLTVYNKELEEKVQERTKEIAAFNENLETIVTERTKKLEELNATKNKLFSIIGHDLKNPINVISNLSELALQKISENQLEKGQNFLKYIIDTSQSTTKLLENLLLWARLQSGHLECNKEKADLHLIVFEGIIVSKNIALKKQITIHNNITKKTFAFVDRYMIGTVIRNLISNALKFTHKGGSVTVDCELKENNSQEKIYEISVKDTGIGIEKENIETLLKIDSNYTRIGTDKEKGSGLGLKLCKDFVEANGGKIWVESEKGKGSKFSFTVPKI